MCPVRKFALCKLYGSAPSGDFWFLLVASKGTRRRQGIRGEVVNFEFICFFQFLFHFLFFLPELTSPGHVAFSPSPRR